MTRFVMPIALALAGLLPVPFAQAQDQSKTDSLLETTKVHKVELRISADDWKTMQPKGGGPPGFGGPMQPKSGGPIRPPGFKFSYEFPYIRAAAAFDNDTLNDIGVRFKGNGTYMMSANGIKRPFRLDFNRYAENGQYRGLKALSLSNNIMDTTRIREAAAYDVFRAANVPAPRTTFVELSLQVPEKYDRELLGVYTAAEPIDKTFLKRHFKSGKGMLLKPENLRSGLEYFGEDWKPYAEAYGPKDEPTDAEKRRLMAFAKLINRADDAAFQKEIGDYLDVDAFLRFLATTTFLSHYDSFIGLGHNYVIYLNPETNKFHLLPWDLDHAFGAFFPFGQPAQLAGASILHPHAGDNKLIDRLLAIPARKAAYFDLFKKLNATAFNTERVTKVIASCEAAVREPIAREEKATKARGTPGGGFGPPGGFGGFGGKPMTVPEFVAERSKSIVAQLAGQKAAFTPRPFGFGPPGGGGFGPPIGFKQPDPAKCAAICKKCAAECEAGAKLCLEAKDDAGAKACLACARACHLCAELSSDKSIRAGDACRLCEQLCQDCATVCEKSDAAHCRACAKLCRACALACADARR